MKFIIFLIIFLIVCSIGMYHRNRLATPEFNDDNCIRALIGEYSKNDYYGMKLIAHAIRNRKTLKGVYGFYAPHVNQEPKVIWELASLAWFESANDEDLTRGAHEWRSIEDIRRGKEPEDMYLIKIYNGIYFYKKPGN